MKLLITGIFTFITFVLSSQTQEKPFQLINSSSHSAEMIFDNMKGHRFRFHIALFKDWEVYKGTDALFMYFQGKSLTRSRIEIRTDTVKTFMSTPTPLRILDTLNTHVFRTNMEYKESGDDLIPEEVFDTLRYSFTHADIEVYREGNRCTDSGWNSMKVKYDEGNVYLKNMNNIKFFEYDLNKNGRKEIYVIHFSCCDEKMKIYRIE